MMDAQQTNIATSVKAKAETIHALTAEMVEELQEAEGQETQAVDAEDIEALFEAIREYARNQHKSMLELIAEHVLDELPMSMAQKIKRYLEDRKPKVKPGEVKYRAFFSSGRSDLSERMEEIIYGPDPETENAD